MKNKNLYKEFEKVAGLKYNFLYTCPACHKEVEGKSTAPHTTNERFECHLCYAKLKVTNVVQCIEVKQNGK